MEKKIFNLNDIIKEAAKVRDLDTIDRRREFNQFGINEMPVEDSNGIPLSDIQDFENYAESKGLDDQQINQLKSYIEIIGEQVSDKVLNLKKAFKFINDFIQAKINENAKKFNNVAPQVEPTVVPQVEPTVVPQEPGAVSSPAIARYSPQYFLNLAKEKNLLPEKITELRDIISRVDSLVAKNPEMYEQAMEQIVAWINSNSSVEEVAPNEEIPADIKGPGEESLDKGTQEAIMDLENINPNSIESLPEQLPEGYNKDSDILPVLAWDRSNKYIDSSSKIYATKQSQQFVNKFLGGPDALSKIKNQASNIRLGLIQLARKSGMTPPDLSIDDIMGVAMMSFYNALGVSKRTASEAQKISDLENPDLVDDSTKEQTLVDNRIAVFAYNNKLVPSRLKPMWDQAESLWDAELAQENYIAEQYNNMLFKREGVDGIEGLLAKYPESNGVVSKLPAGSRPKPIRGKMYANRKSSKFISKFPQLEKGLMEELNRIINLGPNSEEGRELYKAISRRAQSMAQDTIRRKESTSEEQQFAETKDKEGNSGDVSEMVDDSELKNRVEQRGKVLPAKENQDNFRAGLKLTNDFANDFWGSISQSINSVPENKKKDVWNSLERILLKTSLFDYQSEALFSGQGVSGIKKNKINVGRENEYGEYVFDKKKEVSFNVKNSDTPYMLDASAESIVSPAGFHKAYMEMLNMKKDIIDAIKQGANISNVKDVLVNKDPKYGSGFLSKMLNDKTFVQMAASYSYEDVLNEYNSQKELEQNKPGYPARKLSESTGALWSTIAADGLMAVCRKMAKINEEVSNKRLGDEEKQLLLNDLIRARHYFVGLIGVRSDMRSENVPAKVGGGTNQKIKEILSSAGINTEGVDLTSRKIFMMISGAVPIPLDWIPVLSGFKYAQASKIYDTMMYRVAQLQEIKQTLIKVASSESTIANIDDKINEVMNSGRREMRLLFGNV